ncbi:hypothetical protein LC087_19020 (plasmid) [Bacillus carboniphilus]|uniref:Uncharacterized protein n=1 Tax=Bacillus carboniphilus TaxID=86663 RepID=A0ABY9K123_9BACI|nr:hypothetical protein [Bacillus carboniphilus]WLR44400.1 hypothetical protein LC087_19020 [Bacillus carboniphilus]
MSYLLYHCLNNHKFLVKDTDQKDGMSCIECSSYSCPTGYLFREGNTWVDKYPIYKPNKKPLFTITLDDWDSVPIVRFEGEEIENKSRVTFDWETDTLDKKSKPFIRLEHSSASDGKSIKKVEYNQQL